MGRRRGKDKQSVLLRIVIFYYTLASISADTSNSPEKAVSQKHEKDESTDHGMFAPPENRQSSLTRDHGSQMVASSPDHGEWVGSDPLSTGCRCPYSFSLMQTDPSPADGYTYHLERVEYEAHDGAGSSQSIAANNSLTTGHSQSTNNTSKDCCLFPWWGWKRYGHDEDDVDVKK